jgi:hypothetical protein
MGRREHGGDRRKGTRRGNAVEILFKESEKANSLKKMVSRMG